MQNHRSQAGLTGLALAVAIAVGVSVSGAAASAQGRGTGMGAGMPGMGAGMPCMAGMAGMPPDSATRAQMFAIRDLLLNHSKINRTVVTLTDGIRTVTESSDLRLAQVLKSHVATMDGRAVNREHLAMPIESPALRAIMEGKREIRTTIDMTEKGVVVVQTSENPALVTALQTHAAEVSALVAGGMTAMRDAMMKRGPCPGGMGPPKP